MTSIIHHSIVSVNDAANFRKEVEKMCPLPPPYPPFCSPLFASPIPLPSSPFIIICKFYRKKRGNRRFFSVGRSSTERKRDPRGWWCGGKITGHSPPSPPLQRRPLRDEATSSTFLFFPKNCFLFLPRRETAFHLGLMTVAADWFLSDHSLKILVASDGPISRGIDIFFSLFIAKAFVIPL